MIAVLLGLGLLMALPQGTASTVTATLEGHVREGGSRAPIPHARVTVLGSRVRETAVADSQGRFTFVGLAPGRYNLLAKMEGFAFDLVSPPVVVLAAGRTIAVPAHDITGTVVDEQGRPLRALIAFVSQSIQTWVPNQSAGLRVSVSAVASRADGTFRIRGLGPGSYRLTPVPAPATLPQQLPADVMAAGVNGNRSTLQVDVHDADVNGVTIVLRANQR